MSLTNLYQARVLEHNRAPNNRFGMSDATHSARGLDALCGDDLRVWLKVRDGVIEQASWSGEACAITTASASMLSDWLAGRDTDRIQPAYERFVELLDNTDAEDDTELGEINVLRAVGRFPSRKRNALLPWETVLDALERR